MKALGHQGNYSENSCCGPAPSFLEFSGATVVNCVLREVFKSRVV